MNELEERNLSSKITRIRNLLKQLISSYTLNDKQALILRAESEYRKYILSKYNQTSGTQIGYATVNRQAEAKNINKTEGMQPYELQLDKYVLCKQDYIDSYMLQEVYSMYLKVYVIFADSAADNYTMKKLAAKTNISLSTIKACLEMIRGDTILQAMLREPEESEEQEESEE